VAMNRSPSHIVSEIGLLCSQKQREFVVFSAQTPYLSHRCGLISTGATVQSLDFTRMTALDFVT
jgi:hypothetical protein